MLGRARKNLKRKIAGIVAVDAAGDMADVPAEINTSDALGPRQQGKRNRCAKREKTEHAMRNPIQGLQTEVLLLLQRFCCAYLAHINGLILRLLLDLSCIY